MFVGLHVPTDFQVYRHNSEENIMGKGNCPSAALPPPPPPPGYSSVSHVCSLLGLFQQAFCGFHWHFILKWYLICHSVFVLSFVEINIVLWIWGMSLNTWGRI